MEEERCTGWSSDWSRVEAEERRENRWSPDGGLFWGIGRLKEAGVCRASLQTSAGRNR